MDTEGPYANLIIFLIVLALILLNALVNMIFSSLTSLNHQKLREMVENGDSKAKTNKDLCKVKIFKTEFYQLLQLPFFY